MEQITEAVGNPTALLIERFFWLSLGVLLGVAIITSLIRGLNESNNKTKPTSSKELEHIETKAIEQNSDIN